jgi:hypothetical protein
MPRSKRNVRPDDLDICRHVSAAQISPDAQTVAFCASAMTHSATKTPVLAKKVVRSC